MSAPGSSPPRGKSPEIALESSAWWGKLARAVSPNVYGNGAARRALEPVGRLVPVRGTCQPSRRPLNRSEASRGDGTRQGLEADARRCAQDGGAARRKRQTVASEAEPQHPRRAGAELEQHAPVVVGPPRADAYGDHDAPRAERAPQ